MLPVLILLLYFAMQAFILFCCLAAGDDPASREISDMEQMEYIRNWMDQKHSGA